MDPGSFQYYQQFRVQITTNTQSLQNIKQQLEHQKRESERRSHSLKNDSLKLRTKKEELLKEIRTLNDKTKKLSSRSMVANENTEKLKKKVTLNSEEKQIVLHTLRKYISRMLTKSLENLLTCPLNEPNETSSMMVFSNHDTRETYKIYGLLLSACNLKKKMEMFQLPTVADVAHQKPHIDLPRKLIHDAIPLTYDMLTLLPPLIVCCPTSYRETIQDTNRLTWDDDPQKAFHQAAYPLIYYRPVLVYGNQLHVAVKGLVGNSKTEIVSETQSFQDSSTQDQQSATEHLKRTDLLIDAGTKTTPQTTHNEIAYAVYGEKNDPHTNKEMDLSLFDPLRVESYYFSGILVSPNPSSDQDGHPCWAGCSRLTYPTKVAVYEFANGCLMHNHCFKCHVEGCRNAYPNTVTHFHGQLYCMEHSDQIKCPYCKNILDRGHCHRCSRKWFNSDQSKML